MPTRTASWLILLLLVRPAAAHDYPIKPVSVVLRVEPDRVAADIDSDSIYWIEEVTGLHPMPPANWPEDARAKAEAYANAHLRLKADGKPLSGRLIAASYDQKPWEVYEQGRFHLRLQYPAAGDAQNISGEADFFEDYRQERLSEKEPILPIQDFSSVVTLAHHRFDLNPRSISFSVPVSEARRGVFALLISSKMVGLTTVLSSAAGWAALAALALSLAPFPSPKRAALLAAALLLGALPSPGAAHSWFPWLAGALSAVAAGRWLGEGATNWLEAVSAVVLGRFWSHEAFPWLPRAAPGFLERFGAAAGLLAAALVLIAAGLLALGAERRRLTVLSESRASDLFERRRRFAATALLIACGFGFFQG